MAKVNPNSVGSSTGTVVGAVARRENSSLVSVKAVIHVPSPQTGTLAPKVVTHEIPLEKHQDAGPYSFLITELGDYLAINPQSSVDIAAVFADGSVIRDDYNKFVLS